ncbi:YibE/F family protein [Actinoplanes sp. NPDC051411]|uniref:YibE/F family protein n=1 Tax=Actinoplanes sp. NPDC051411 TaxID=3155522 RepID=UPI00341D223C
MTHHGAPPAASRHTRRVVTAVLVPCALATLVALIILWPARITPAPDTSGGQRALGTVETVSAQSATVRITDGPGAGTTQTVDAQQGPGAIELRPGAKVVLLYQPDAVPGGPSYSVTDAQRSAPLLWLAALTLAAIVAFGRWRGLTSLAGLAVSFAILLLFVLPAIAHGESPLLVAVVGASAIMFAAMYLTQGVSVVTSVAVAGTLASLVLTGLLGFGFTTAMNLSGVADDNTSSLLTTFHGIDLHGLLLAGIVIGALGVLIDITVGQAVTVAEMALGHTSRWDLYRAATRVGQAHVAAAVNTIILAYAGTSLPLLLLIAANNGPVGDLLTSEFIGEEIIRSAVGTIGLVASVPITTALATLVVEVGPSVPATSGRHARQCQT